MTGIADRKQALEGCGVYRSDDYSHLPLNIPNSASNHDVPTQTSIQTGLQFSWHAGLVLLIEIEPLPTQLLNRNRPGEVIAKYLLQPRSRTRLAGQEPGIKHSGLIGHSKPTAKLARAKPG